jgi:hypothetical protein
MPRSIGSCLRLSTRRIAGDLCHRVKGSFRGSAWGNTGTDVSLRVRCFIRIRAENPPPRTAHGLQGGTGPHIALARGAAESRGMAWRDDGIVGPLQPVIAPIGPSGLARRVSGRRSAPWAQPITAIASAGPAVCFGRVDWQRSRLRCGPAPAIAFASQPGKPERAQRRHSNGQTSGHGAEQRGLGCGAAEPHLHTQSVDLALFSRALVSAISAFRGVMLTPTPDLSSMALVDRIYEYTSPVASRDAALTQAR